MNNDVIAESHIPCEVCGSSDAKTLYADGHGFCFSCKHYYPSGKELYMAGDFTYEFLPLRGITKEVMSSYDVKTKINEDGKPIAIGFKYPNGAIKVRLLDKKEFYTEGKISEAGLFGMDKFAAGSFKTVTITEGELDALSLHQVLHTPVVSVQSSASAQRDVARCIDYLRSFDRIYLAFDNDPTGRKTTADVAKLFDYNKVFDVKFSNRKDANEYLQAGEEHVLKNLWWSSKKYLPESIISSMDDFKKILLEPPPKGVSYPFPTLTKMTYGIRTGESVLITAMEGVGKTEIMHAIEHHLLKETQNAIGAIYLEEPKKRHLQALAGLELKKPVHLPDCDCTQDQVLAALERLVQVDDRLHLYSHFGSDDPDVLLDTIRFLVSVRGCRYILLDHITMAVSGIAGENDERRALDYLSTRLQMMVTELDFALIVVSHVNDFGQTRGSRYISKLANVRIHADRDINNPNTSISNVINLTIKDKNRFGGKTGPAGRLVFDETAHVLREEESWEDTSIAA